MVLRSHLLEPLGVLSPLKVSLLSLPLRPCELSQQVANLELVLLSKIMKRGARGRRHLDGRRAGGWKSPQVLLAPTPPTFSRFLSDSLPSLPSLPLSPLSLSPLSPSLSPSLSLSLSLSPSLSLSLSLSLARPSDLFSLLHVYFSLSLTPPLPLSSLPWCARALSPRLFPLSHFSLFPLDSHLSFPSPRPPAPHPTPSLSPQRVASTGLAGERALF